MPKIVQKESSALRLIAKDVPLAEIGSAKINKILKDMSKALAKEDDGVALAAPQIAVPLRIFVVSGKIFAERDKDDRLTNIPPDLVFINPQITKLSRKKEEMDEGCLSVRWLYGKTKRSSKATIEAYDEHGKKFSWSGAGLMAQIFQHETDHLNGILFTDHATEVQDMPPEKQK
jgi:peptide deformylase